MTTASISPSNHSQRDLAMPRISLTGVRFGNLNTAEDLAAAHATLP